ncbi:hypothetical protein ACLMJK_002870 [Lecanora helva]
MSAHWYKESFRLDRTQDLEDGWEVINIMWKLVVVAIATFLHIITATPQGQSPATSTKPTFPTPSVFVGPKDPCGPAVQDRLDPTIPNDTCKSNITYSPSPATYGATLLNDGSGHEINYDNCYPVVLDVCAAIASIDTPLGVWNWTDVGSECVMGFWLPDLPGAAPRMNVRRCENQVFRPMVDIGEHRGGAAYNQVVVNLRVLPDDSQTGVQVSAGYPSYTISYLPLIKGNQSTSPA